MEYIEIFVLGVFIKCVTGFDDMITRVPVIAAVARRRRGKVAFSIGVFLAVSVATGIAYFFSELLHDIPAYRTIVTVLLFLLAAALYFDLFKEKSRPKSKERVRAQSRLSLERYTQLIGIGFFASILTVLDDVIAYMPLFLVEKHLVLFGVAGIAVGTLLQAALVVFFAEKIETIPYKEEIAATGLVLLGTGILLGLI